MRLHSLEITAFGPFAGTERVDFDELGADGLFLLHGQTGAGKTTVLDAVAFALYGTVPGARQDGRRLRSDHAATGERPEVVLEATIGGRDLRIRRSPEYIRPSKRGGGETKEQARVTLEWLDGSGENLSRIPDVGAEVVRLLGMSAEQFFQVVLLPQGEFARFLKAETKTRAALLEKLFDTGRFGTVEGWFVERRRAGAAAVDRGRQLIAVATAGLTTAAGDIVSRLDEGRADGSAAPHGETSGEDVPAARNTAEQDGADGADDDESTDPPLDPVEDPVAWAEAVVACAEAESAQTAAELESLRISAAEVRSRADRVQEHARAHHRRATALTARAAHEADQPARDAAAAELEAAGRAERVDWADGARAEAAAERDAVAARIGVACDEFEAMGPDSASMLDEARATEGGTLDTVVLANTLNDWDAELVRLDAAARDEEALLGLIDEQSELEAKITGLDDDAARITAQMDELPAAIARAQGEHDEAVAAAQSLDGLRIVLESARATEQATLALPGAHKFREEAAAALTAAETDHNSARTHALDLRERRLNGMAAELAGELRDGFPCTVCGSTEHPAPATGTDDSVTKDDEEAAAAVVETAARHVDTCRRALHDADTDVALHEERAGGVSGPDAAEGREAAAAALAKAEHTASGRDDAAIALETLRARQVSGEEDAQRIDADRGALAKESAGAQARITDLRSRLDAAVGRDVSVRERTTQLRDRRERLDVVVGLLGRLETAERALRKNEQAVADAASEAGFEGAVSALAAVRTRSRRIEIEADLAAANDEAVRVRAILAEPEIVAVADTELGDVDAALTEAAEAEKTLEAAVRRQDQASARSAGVAQEAGKVKKAVAAFGPVAAKHAWLSDLTEVMIGDGENSRRMSLRSYVLAARLEEVAVVASQRLRAMSGGRYDFVHTEATVKRERRGGLGLDILDANTGTVRPTSTLSGGETFMASLSLALGLADVVSEEAGGIQLETLFIDEGFGSLDAESLDTVMAVLDELRDGGRAVGVVSHVAEMKHRIPSRLYVAKSESGSTLRMTSAGAA